MSDKNELLSALKEQGKFLIRGNRLEEARDLFMQICARQPTDADTWCTLIYIHSMLGNIDAAVDCGRKAIALQPRLAIAHTYLGNVYTLKNRHNDAQASYREALRLDPHNALAYCNLGNSLESSGKSDEAIAYYQDALRVNPDLVEALINLGNIYFKQSRLDESMACQFKALQLVPSSVQALNTLGNIHARQSKPDDAMTNYRQALRFDPKNAITYCNVGNLLQTLDRSDEAAIYFQKALSLDPGCAGAYIGLGNIASDNNRDEEALSWHLKALRLRPSLSQAYNNIGGIYIRQGNVDEALKYYREAVRLDPHNAEAHSSLLFASSHSENIEPAALYAEHVRWGEMHGQPSTSVIPHENTRDPNKRLRIGYVSGDFRNHPVGVFIEQVLTHHDRRKFEIYCYNNYPKGDNLTERLRQHTHHWRDVVNQSDVDLAKLIRRDGIDILIDLAGHTTWNRLLTFAYKPAPVQATWMSYIATTGLKAIDYIIANRYIIPPNEERYYTERVIRLPNSFLCFTAPRFDINVGALPALLQKRVTFGCFNNAAKITETVVNCWAKVLHALPDARLHLKHKVYRDTKAQQRYRDLFVRQGIDPERIIFLSQSPRDLYLAAYNEVDIGLDPFPYNGGTTTIESLWMGVPVITLRGDRFVSHMGENIMMNLGLPECVTDSQEAYIAKAVALASDLPRLAELRTGLRDQLLKSTLCDGPGFTNDLEATYRTMWKNWCETQPHKHE